MKTANCSSCGAPIIWAGTTYSKMMPLDAEPVPDGNILLSDTGIAYLGGEGALPLFAEAKWYKSHFATCPNSKQNRKLKR